MSYQVLARKWRPHTFEHVVGQHHVLTALTNALDQGRLHHAYLLSGTRGVGKTTIARILAKSLNCEQGISSHPCGVCDTCREIDQGNFVDLLEIDAASRTKVEVNGYKKAVEILKADAKKDAETQYEKDKIETLAPEQFADYFEQLRQRARGGAGEDSDSSETDD